MDKFISVIVPTYNERDNIKPLVEGIHRALKGEDFEIVFIDDNSRDGTAEAIEALADRYPVRFVVRQDERGLASAVVRGFAQATGELLAVMDADLQHPPAVLRDMVRAARDGADLVIASRYVQGGSCEGWGLTRRVISRGAIFLAHLLLPRTRHIGDPMAGFFLLKRPVIAGAALKPSGYKILLEVLMIGRYDRAVEVPYSFCVREKGESKLKARTQIDYLKHLFSLMTRTGELWRFLKFAVVGGSGVLVNLGVYWLITRLLHMNIYGAQAVSFEASVISNFLLNNFFTFADRRVSQTLPFLIQFLKFNGISLAGYGIQVAALFLLHTVLGVYDVVALAIGIIVATVWNYLVNLGWTWK
jgi:dolichol-phosphate mannosyltransferase